MTSFHQTYKHTRALTQEIGDEEDQMQVYDSAPTSSLDAQRAAVRGTPSGSHADQEPQPEGHKENRTDTDVESLLAEGKEKVRCVCV